MTRVEWGDHHEQRLELRHDSGCQGEPLRHGVTDQRPFAKDGCVVFGDDEFHLPLGKLAEFVATLYEAAGLPVPIVLDPVDEAMFASWIHVKNRRLGGTVLIDPHSPLGFADVRNLAAALVAAVERAESEPDPEQVEALAGVLRSAPELTYEAAARAILAAGYRPPEKDGQR